MDPLCLQLDRRRSLDGRLLSCGGRCVRAGCRGMRLRTGIMHWTSAVPWHACLTSSGHGVCSMDQVMSLSHLAMLLQMRLLVDVICHDAPWCTPWTRGEIRLGHIIDAHGNPPDGPSGECWWQSWGTKLSAHRTCGG
eukprot:4600997-Amphidinium_carterae.2